MVEGNYSKQHVARYSRYVHVWGFKWSVEVSNRRREWKQSVADLSVWGVALSWCNCLNSSEYTMHMNGYRWSIGSLSTCYSSELSLDISGISYHANCARPYTITEAAPDWIVPCWGRIPLLQGSWFRPKITFMLMWDHSIILNISIKCIFCMIFKLLGTGK